MSNTQDMSTPEARAAYYETSWKLAAEAGNVAREQVAQLRRTEAHLRDSYRNLQERTQLIEEAATAIGFRQGAEACLIWLFRHVEVPLAMAAALRSACLKELLPEPASEAKPEPDESDVCGNCGGEGFTSHDCGEDSCCCPDPEDNVPCQVCRGTGAHPSSLPEPTP